jgi:ADP-dependent NAD(P)H-hydrate dehydratase / NAD(P)H-hydrate epimerase
MTIPVLRCAALRRIEHMHAEARPSLMERAGRAAADLASRLQRGLDGPPLIFAGPGNNGGDAFVTARWLLRHGMQSLVVFADDVDSLPTDARAAYWAWRGAGGAVVIDVPDGHYGLVIDGLFGIGLSRAIEGRYAEWIARINAYRGPVLALDCPSGLIGDTGAVSGPAVHARYTMTFIAKKPGLLTSNGPDLCGEIVVADLGLDASVRAADGGKVVDVAMFANQFHPRKRNSHKGSYGSVGILGGAAGMAGAALLAGRAALKLGAGRVYVGMLERIALDPLQPELMLRAADEIFSLATVLAVGPGLGVSTDAGDLLLRAIESPLPLVIDADALNIVAARPVFARQLGRRTRPAILTPHPAEAARLLATTVDAVQADRLACALELARRFHAHVVLKGCGSVIALVDGRWFINTSGNAGLATAGTGDVLCGMMAALLAQGWPEDAAALCATHLHGVAADRLVNEGIGPVGLTAGELITSARRQLNRWISADAPSASDTDPAC